MTTKFVVVRNVREFDESVSTVVVSDEFDTEKEAESASNVFDSYNHFYDSWHSVVTTDEV